MLGIKNNCMQEQNGSVFNSGLNIQSKNEIKMFFNSGKVDLKY